MAPSRRCVFVLLVATAATLHLTAGKEAVSPGALPKEEGPCYDATDPKLWPVKPESQVCGTDGLLYPSKSALECAKTKSEGGSAATLAVQPRDKCGAKAKLYDPCPMTYASLRNVCGSDNAIYTNVFHMACTAKNNSVVITVKNAGVCKVDYPYSPMYKPVCSSSGRTYPNEEALKREQLELPYSKLTQKHAGECKSDLPNDPCVVIENEFSPSPLCASNGHTYATLREIRCLKKTKPALAVLHYGACTIQDVEKIVGQNDVCKAAINTYKVKAFCGSDNVTYNDAYTVLCKAKNTPKDKKMQVAHAYEAACFAIETCPTPPASEMPKPVCGSDGVFYSDENNFICAKQSSKTLKKASSEYCSTKKLEKDPCLSKNVLGAAHQPYIVPVCGSNKVTYVTSMDLFCASKTKPEIELLHQGKCF